MYIQYIVDPKSESDWSHCYFPRGPSFGITLTEFFSQLPSSPSSNTGPLTLKFSLWGKKELSTEVLQVLQSIKDQKKKKKSHFPSKKL